MADKESEMKVVRYGQINLHKSKAATAELNRRVEYDVAFITEPYAPYGLVRIEAGKGCIISSRGTKKNPPRACLRLCLPSWPMDEFTNRDMATAMIRLEGGDFCVASLYLDIDYKVNNESFIQLIERCESQGTPLIMGLDSNAHSQLWGCEESNQRGEELEAILLEHEMVVLNQDDVPTFITEKGKSIIDITIANRYAIEKWDFEDWRVDLQESFSDHRYITFSGGTFVPEKREVRNLNKTNWTKFREQLANVEWLTVDESSNLNDLAEFFERQVEEAIEIACPRKPAINRRPNSWWTVDLEKSRKNCRNLRALKDKDLDSLKKYRVAREEHKKLVSDTKKAAWKNFCGQAESTTDISKLLKVIEGRPARVMSMLKDTKGISNTPEKAVDILLKTHFPDHKVNVNQQVNVSLSEQPKADDNSTSMILDYITTAKVRSAMRSFGSKRAPGPDGFKPIILKNLDEKSVAFLTETYKLSVLRGQIPLKWRQMNVTFIPKPGKSDYASPKAYRPITLSSFVLKGLERLMLWYLRENIITTPLKSQHAYTMGLSTETALSEVLDYVEKAFYNKQKVLAISLDCTGAFDYVSFEAAEMALKEHQVPEAITAWYTSLLKGRQVTAELQGVTSTITPGKGSPQGGILSPIVWNLVMDSLLSTFQGNAVKVVGYADDIIIMASGHDITILQQNIQKALDRTLKWGDNKGLCFNPNKTQAILFCRARKGKVTHPAIRMGEQTLKFSDRIEYLGVTIQCRLTWSYHIRKQLKKANMLLNRVRTLIGKEWGLDPEKLIWIYTAIARPKISYGSLVWAHTMGQTLKEQLNKMQIKILRACSGAQRSTPLDVMEVAMGLIPLDLHIEELAARSRLRTRYILKDTWDGIAVAGSISKYMGHRGYWDNYTFGVRDIENPTVKGHSWIEWEDILEEDTDIKIYADGAMNETGSGYGFVVVEPNGQIHSQGGSLGKVCPYEAELFAIRAALSWLISNPQRLKGKVVIYTDSKSVELTLKSQTVKSTSAKEVIELVEEVKLKCQLDIKWLKGHSGNKYHDEADAIAKANASISKERELPVTLKDVKLWVQEKTKNKWQRRWVNSNRKHAMKFISDVNPIRMKNMKKVSRVNLGLIFQVISGHGLFGHHLAKWHDIDPECTCCLDAEETPWHLWNECEALSQQRKDVKSQENLPLEASIIQFFKLTDLREITRVRTDQIRKTV